MLAIAHFAAGVSGALALLIWQPAFVAKYIGNLIKSDLFFVLSSGFFAMLPDLPKLFNMGELKAMIHDSWITNLFWGHKWLDLYPDTAQAAAIPITIAIIMAYVYYKGI